MAFSDWDRFTAGDAAVNVDFFTPIDANQSVQFIKTSGTASSHANVTPTASSGLTKGVTNGRMRTLVRIDTMPTNFEAGIIGMQTVTDFANATGQSAYGAVIQGTGFLALKKYTNGLASAGTNLATPVAFPVPSGVFSLELMWFHDVPEFAGTRLEVRTGTMTDYSDLALQIILNDVSSPLSASVAEGLFVHDLGSNGNFDIVFDKTQLYTVAFV